MIQQKKTSWCKKCQQLLRVGKNTLLELLHTRQIDGFRIGNRWRVTKKSVVKFMVWRKKHHFGTS